MVRKNYINLALIIFVFALALLFLMMVQRIKLEASTINVSFTLGFLLILGFSGGRIAASFTLPRLTGFLAVGVLCGPSVLGLIGPEQIKALAPFNELALALIATQAGAEISLKFLKGGTKSIFLVILSQSFIIIFGMILVFLLLVYVFGFNIASSNESILAIAVIFAILSISKAPADTLAILGETGLKGVFANHVLGVVVLIDILVIVLFQVALLVVKPLLVPQAFFDSQKLIILFEELFSSLAAGVTVGLIFIGWFYTLKLKMRQNILFLILASFLVVSMCQYLRYDALIVFIVAGFMVSNMSKRGHDLVDAVETISPGVMIVFFATAGAMLDLDVLNTLWPYALALAFSRIGLTAIGTLLGHKWSSDDLFRYRYSFAGYISQAGVTLVLAQNAARALGDIGQKLAALATAMVAINELIGPIAFKLAIKREISRKSLKSKPKS
jgi:Kef-type K+ transport system membrane component KefB